MGPAWDSKPASPRLEKKSERTQRFLAGLEGLRRITTDSSCGDTRFNLSFFSSAAAAGRTLEGSVGLVTTSGSEEEENSGVIVESVTRDKRWPSIPELVFSSESCPAAGGGGLTASSPALTPFDLVGCVCSM